MTRINVLSPARLIDAYLFSEWRELPRVFRLALDGRPTPPRYTLGEGHMRFFLPHLGWLGRRHADLTRELLARGYNLTPHPPLPTDGGDWEPDDAAIALNLARLHERTVNGKREPTFWRRPVPRDFYRRPAVSGLEAA